MYDQLELFFKDKQNRALYKTGGGDYLEILEKRLYSWLCREIAIVDGEIRTGVHTYNAEEMACAIGFKEMSSGHFMDWENDDTKEAV